MRILQTGRLPVCITRRMFQRAGPGGAGAGDQRRKFRVPRFFQNLQHAGRNDRVHLDDFRWRHHHVGQRNQHHQRSVVHGRTADSYGFLHRKLRMPVNYADNLQCHRKRSACFKFPGGYGMPWFGHKLYRDGHPFRLHCQLCMGFRRRTALQHQQRQHIASVCPGQHL